MKTTLLVTAGFLLIASAAPAQWDPHPDGIGVYLDPSGSSCPELWLQPYTTVTGYLLGTRLSHGGCSGWEAALLIYPASLPAGITFDIGAGAINNLIAPDFQVALSPAVTGNVAVLLRFSTFYMGGGMSLGVGPSVPSSFGGLTPGYTDPLDPSVRVPLTTYFRTPWTLPIYRGTNTTLPPNGPANSYVVLVSNFETCGLPSEGATWGGVKAIYGR
jgi:hypothetical protein